MDHQTIANIAAVMKPYYEKPSNQCTWEKALVAVAVTVFRAPDNNRLPMRFTIRGKPYTESGTGSKEWNDAIVAVGDGLRQAENPDPHDYSRAHYRSIAQRLSVAQRVAQLLEVEIGRRGL